jgi:hypothetical protein
MGRKDDDSNTVTIDLDKWATPKQLASELGYGGEANTQRISNWIRRQKVTVWRIEELNIVLVDRNTIPSHA